MQRRNGKDYEWPVEQLRQWIEADGLTHHDVGSRLGVNPKLVSKACARFEIRSQRRGPRSGPGHPEWKGGRTLDKHGYVLLYRPGHPMARRMGNRGGRYVLEHRLVMAEHLGRLLEPFEVIHHKNGDPQDNRLENLELYTSNAQHLRDELTGRCPRWSEEGKRKLLEATRRRWRLASLRKTETGGSATP